MVEIVFGIDDANPFFDRERKAPEWDILTNLLSTHNHLKVTQFVPGSYSMPYGKKWGAWKTLHYIAGKKPRVVMHNTYSLEKNPDWCQRIKNHPQMEAGMHGLFHVNPSLLNAQEFIGLSAIETVDRIKKSLYQFQKGGFPRPKIMAPPGWGVTPSLLNALKKNHVGIAGNLGRGPQYEAGWDAPNTIRVEKIGGLTNVPRNMSIDSFDEKKIDTIIEQGGIIALHGHFRNIGVKNGITDQNMHHVDQIISHVEAQEKISYRFMGDYL